MNISVIAAVFNEINIKETVDDWINFLNTSNHVQNFEIILCDDHSGESYFRDLEKYYRDETKVVLIRNDENEGPGFSFSRCIHKVQYEYTLINDSDGQFPIHNLESIITDLNEFGDGKKPEIVFTHREKKYDNRVNVFGQKVSNLLCNRIYKTDLNDFTCAFKFVKTNLLKRIQFDARYMNYSLDHTSKLLETGERYIDFPVVCNIKEARKRGAGKEFKRAWDRVLYIIYLWLRKRLLLRRVLFHQYNKPV